MKIGFKMHTRTEVMLNRASKVGHVPLSRRNIIFFAQHRAEMPPNSGGFEASLWAIFYSIAPRIPPGQEKGQEQWAMDDGQWAMGNGQWAMGSGQWAIFIVIVMVLSLIHI